MAKLSIVLIVICIGGFVASFFRSSPEESSPSSQAVGLDAIFQQQANAVGQRQQRKKFSSHNAVPLEGNEVSLVNLMAKPEEYQRKPFVIFGQILPANAAQNRSAPYTFRFQELTEKHQKIPQATAKLQLASKQAHTLIRQMQKNSQAPTHGRFRVIFPPSQTKTSPLQLEILDWQFAQNDHSGFGPWNTESLPSS